MKKKAHPNSDLAIINRWLMPVVACVLGLGLVALPARLGAQPVPMPIVPLIVIYLWAMFRPSAWAGLVIFCLGLAHDLLTFGPLGVWTAIYLITFATVAGLRRAVLGRPAVTLWAVFALVAVIVAGLAKALGWLAGVEPSERLLALQLLFTVLLYPPVAFLLRPVQATSMEFHREDPL